MSGKARASPDAATEDTILGGRIRLRQPKTGYRVAIDSVLLPAAVPARAGDTVLDLGAGTGAAALCLVHRVPGARVVGLELQPALARLARLNAALNGVSDSVDVAVGDVAHPPDRFAVATFSHAMMNPPHLAEARVRAPRSASRRTAHVEGTTPLAAWIDLALRSLKPRGTLTLIHRADRLAEILGELDGRAGDIVVFPLWPKSRGKPAIRVIVRARRGAASPLRLEAGLVLHEDGGAYTREADRILRDGGAIDLAPRARSA
jgi:tRNA1(Val) A37 N6-methylase TrmN6